MSSSSGKLTCSLISTDRIEDNTSGAGIQIGSFSWPTDNSAVGVFKSDGSGGITISQQATTRSTVSGAAYSIPVSDYIVGITGTNSTTLTLPDPSVKEVGSVVYVVKEVGSTNVVTINPFGTELICGQPSLGISDGYASTALYTDGTNWFRLFVSGVSTIVAGTGISISSSSGDVTVSTAPELPFATLGNWIFSLENMFQDTSGLIPVTDQGQVVNYVSDLSGNGNHIVTAPEASGTVTSLIKGGRFVNSQTLMVASTLSVPANKTVAFAITPTAGLQNNELTGSSDSSQIIDFGTFNQNNRVRVRNGTSDIYSGAGTVAYGQLSIMVITYDGTNTTIRVNGTQIVSQGNDAFGWTSTGLYIGGTPALPARSFDGTILQIMYMPVTTSETELQEIEGNICDTWKANGLLPTTHKYGIYS